MKAKVLILLLSGLGLLSLKVTSQSLAPTVLAAAGSSACDADIRVAWTLGEPIIQTAGTITQGFHSAEIPLLTSTAAPFQNSRVQAFPNPVDGLLHLQFEAGKPGAFRQASIWNTLSHQQLAFGIPAEADAYDINCFQLVPGIYWLVLRNQDGSLFYTLRFVKN
ncbi:MAG: hypothetical protein ABIO24_13510 [Saprospiraceae bacterium]